MPSKMKIRFYRTIGFKISIWYFTTVFGILIVSGTFLSQSLQHNLFKKADELIRDEEEELLASLTDSNTSINALKSIITLEFSEDRYYKLSTRLMDGEGNLIIASDNFLDKASKLPENIIAKLKIGSPALLETIRIKDKKYPFRLLTKTIYQDGGSLKYILQIRLYMKPMYSSLRHLRRSLLILTPIIFMFCIAGGWYISRKSLSPIGAIIKTTREITSSNLNRRLVINNTGDDLDKLAFTINRMLDRIERSFNRAIKFTSDASHELRTPITAIKIGTEVILLKDRTPEEYRKLHENNLTTLNRMSRMIEDLLLLSRSDSVENILNVKKINLSNLLKDLYSKFSLISNTKQIELSMNEIPDIQINGDEILLRRVFSNLLDNAIKYTPPKGSVCLSLEDCKDEVIARIHDTGIGIPEDLINKIFDRFFSANSLRSRDAGGAGLGLNICKNIVKLHNGRIEVKSKLNEGSIFEVILPKNLTNS